jgi:hypothetical protein
MHDNKPNNFYIKHFFIIFQIKKLQRLFDTFVSLGIFILNVSMCNIEHLYKKKSKIELFKKVVSVKYKVFYSKQDIIHYVS